MNERESEAALAEALEDYHRRRALGEAPTTDDYRARLGVAHADFVAMVDAESAIDEALFVPPPEALPRVFGGYTLLRELGRGAAGVVYEALHRDLHRKVALKILRTGFDTDATALERFRREARACARVHHPHVVEVFEAGDVDGRPYYAMSLVEGDTLAALVKAGRLPEPKALAAGLAGVAEGLHALHAAGVVHRDVKPSNIMVRPSGQMVLADFGLARSSGAQSITDTGAMLGTPMYMSPEQILGRRDEVDARSDVYGLGATLYETATGKAPFRTEELQALLRAILTSRPAAPRAVARGVPADLAAIALKAIEKRKEDRYATAADLARDLRAFAAGGYVEGRPVSVPVRALRAVRRRWLPIAAAAAVAAALGAWWTQRDATLGVTVAIPPDGAQIFVDGALRGTTTADVDLDPGDHRLVVRKAGFSDEDRPLRLEPGERRTLEIAMRADPRDGAAVAAVAAALGIPSVAPVLVEPVRGSSHAAAAPVYPAGRVRRSSLSTYRVDVTPALQGAANLRFFADDRADPIHESVFDPRETGPFEAALPPEVLAAAGPGARIRWGLFGMADSDDATAEATVVDDPALDARLDALEGTEAFGRQSPLVRDLLYAWRLEAEGLDGEALSTFARIVARAPSACAAWEGVVRVSRAGNRERNPLYERAVAHLVAPPAATPPDPAYASVRERRPPD